MISVGAAAAVAYSKLRTSGWIAFAGDSVETARHSSLRDAYDWRHCPIAVAAGVAAAAAVVGLGAAVDLVAAAPFDQRLFHQNAIPLPGPHGTRTDRHSAYAGLSQTGHCGRMEKC